MTGRKFCTSTEGIRFAVSRMAASCQSLTRARFGWLILSLWLLSILGGNVNAVADSLPRSAVPQAQVPGKSEGLDEAGWTSLQAAVRKSIYLPTRLSTRSAADEDGEAGEAVDKFGFSVALSGNTALVGAVLDDAGGNIDQGSAYVFTRTGASWTQQAQLVAVDGAGNDQFGSSVALSGDTALVGAYLDDVSTSNDRGSAYVFTRTGTSWTQQAQLVAEDGLAGDWFGHSVALFGDTALVSAVGDDVGANGDQGSTYVFTRTGTSWTQQAQLVAEDGAGSDIFGFSVALSGDTALVGAVLDNVGALDQGSAYVFTRAGTDWTQQAHLFVGDGAGSDHFGYSVALSGDTALVGVNEDDVGANANQGSAYVFTRTGTNWTQQAHLVAGDGAVIDFFGWSVSLSGDTALVGAVWDEVGANPQQGSAYVFSRTGTIWTQQAQLIAGDGTASDQFGWSIALFGDTALVGANLDDVGANTDQGSTYVFSCFGTSWTQQAHLMAGDNLFADGYETPTVALCAPSLEE